MLTGKKRGVVLNLAVSTLLGVVVRADDTEFAARQNEAKQAVLSGAGRDYYYGPFSKALAAGFNQRVKQLKKCREDEREMGASFDILLKLADDGRVDAAIANPESRIATCYLKQAQKDSFPRPPSAGFWVEVRVDATIYSGIRKAMEVPLAAPARPTHLLIASLSSEDPSVRSAAALELAGAKELKAEALAALKPLRFDADRSVRYAAGWAFYQLSRPYDAGRFQTPPQPIKQPRPQYPQDAFIAKIEGTVMVDILIGEQGEVARAEIRQSIPALDAAALASARKWIFKPALVNGQPAVSLAVLPIAFRIY